MNKTVISNYNELEQWLTSHDFFESGHILSVRENPLEIIVGYNVKGDFSAFSERHIQSYKLTPGKILEWSYDNESFPLGEDHYIDAIDAHDVANRVYLEFSVPETFRLVTDFLTIEEQELIKTTFQPWVNETEIHVKCDLPEIPKPGFWLEQLHKYGHELVFRYYSGEAKALEQVPYPDYQGYFLQLPDRIEASMYGIFFGHLSTRENCFFACIKNKDTGLESVWENLMRVLIELPNVAISSGNYTFTRDSWKQYLDSKQLPAMD